MPANNPALGLSAVPLPMKTRKMLPGCHVAEADGLAAAAATGAPAAAVPEPPTCIALADGCTTPTTARAARPVVLRDTAAAGREPDTPTEGTAV